jgi:hypothetical protein
MKKILFALIIIVIASCSEKPEFLQDLTSFVFVHNVKNLTLSNCSVGYYINGIYNKIADLGDMTTGKYTDEMILQDDAISEVSLLINYQYEFSFPIRKKAQNILELSQSNVAKIISQENHVSILDEAYEPLRGRYQNLSYNFINDDVICFYIDLTRNAGIILEVSKQLLGQNIVIEPSDKFWFFSIGDGLSPFTSFNNTKTDNADYTGWFMIDINEQTSECSLGFGIVKNGKPFARGRISDVWGKIVPNS